MGHSWGSIEDNAGNQVSHGWWPKSPGADPMSTLLGKQFPGELTTQIGLNDIKSTATVSFAWNITKSQYGCATEFVSTYAQKNTWALNTQCSTFATSLARETGIKVPWWVTFPVADPNKVGQWLKTLKQ